MVRIVFLILYNAPKDTLIKIRDKLLNNLQMSGFVFTNINFSFYEKLSPSEITNRIYHFDVGWFSKLYEKKEKRK